MKRNKKGFTLIELLAVIAILAIILVIAVPQVIKVVDESRNKSLMLSAKLIASNAEAIKLTNNTHGIKEEITCDMVSEISTSDYKKCIIEFDNNYNALVTIIGKGKYEGKTVCKATSNEATMPEVCPMNGVQKIETLLIDEETLNNGLQETTATYTNADNEEITVDAGIRYVGAADEVNNQVYFNCDDKDLNGIEYGLYNYDYKGSCEVWRIIGVFGVNNGTKTEKRIKIINTNSTFEASWDSSSDGSVEGENAVNSGNGVNQWGPSTLTDGTSYSGADIMQLLNGFYIGKTGSECKYNTDAGQFGFSQICTTDSLKTSNMKPLTSNALSMINNALWYTYASSTGVSESAYLQERGITNKYTGCSNIESTTTNECSSDGVTRNNEWLGLVGLMSLSDMAYSNVWLYNQTASPVSITSNNASYARFIYAVNTIYSGPPSFNTVQPSSSKTIWPSVYLRPDVEIIGGNGNDEPFKLSI